MGSGGIAPLILNLSTTLRWVVIVTPRTRAVERFWTLWRRVKQMLVSRIEPLFLDSPAC